MSMKVSVWEENIVIPTYEPSAPDRNPLFLEKRVYQGSSGKIYPHPMTDKVSDVKTDHTYHAVWLENDYLKVMILPELGGRVQRAYDKTRNYDFVYYNHVIKPALVGLAGPWISGGIEFNWPQHHRPSTYDPVNFTCRENADGSATVICSEIENMFHTKSETEFTLYPDKAYLELKNHLYNRTETDQTFLWWANPAVAVNEHYSSIFPPDVTAVMDHGKRDVSTFPIATGVYYKVDYSAGVDISKYVNLPVPTSYMAAKSDFDFVGGFDYGVQAGILHVADHHVSPGKKQWTWGCGDFGKAWDRNLTDEDGPYFELMTGCFTDNQPDFGYIGPMETRDFTQYFMPYHDLGQVHNANKDLSLHLDVTDDITATFYCSGTLGLCDVRIEGRSTEEYSPDECGATAAISYTASVDLQCAETVTVSVKNPGLRFDELKVTVLKNGRPVLVFDGNVKKQDIPDAARPAPLPGECATTEDLYLYGTHIEQYRHATRRAEDYYLEGLKRDATDVRLNHAYGMLLLKKGRIEESEPYFRAALTKITRSNPNPSTGVYSYGLGLCLFDQHRDEEAFDVFYKATWNSDTAASAFYFMALIRSRGGAYEEALEYVNRSLRYNAANHNAQDLKILLFQALAKNAYSTQAAGSYEKAACDALSDALRLDPMNLMAQYLGGTDIKPYVINANMMIDLSLELTRAGFFKEALEFLALSADAFPMTDYYRAYNAAQAGLEYSAFLNTAASDDPYCCFPNRLTDIEVLQFAIDNNPADARAPYYLGCLLYDRERHADAIAALQTSVARGADFATPYRTLSLLYYNVLGEADRALAILEQAYAMDETDARVLYELDLLKKRMGIAPEVRKAFLDSRLALVHSRDDLLLEHITLQNLLGKHEKALELIAGHRFHPWEGGEGKVPEQYLLANVALGLKNADEARYRATYTYPENLGEGKLHGAQENRQNYYLGCLLEAAGRKEEAQELFLKASSGISVPASAMYYNDQPPETIFYQGLAWKKLGNAAEANHRFDLLIEYGDAHMNDHVAIDYFAVSLPDLLVFDEDLDVKNRLHCLFMKALGLYGKGEKAESLKLFTEALSVNCNTFQIATHYALLFKED